MTREEIIKKIEEIEEKKFYLNMKNHWSGQDYMTNSRYSSDLIQLRKLLK